VELFGGRKRAAANHETALTGRCFGEAISARPVHIAYQDYAYLVRSLALRIATSVSGAHHTHAFICMTG
jgi:hypothetical protein